MKKEIDVAKINAAFQKAFPQAKQDLAQKGEVTQKVPGLAGLGALDDTVDTFCEAWPKVKPFLNFVLKGFGWFFPSQVAMAKGVFAGIDELTQEICD